MSQKVPSFKYFMGQLIYAGFHQFLPIASQPSILSEKLKYPVPEGKIVWENGCGAGMKDAQVHGECDPD
jgi:hypothetical protein